MAFSIINHFWQWFQHNSSTYLQLTTMSEDEMVYWVNESLIQIRSVDKHLYLYFSFPKDNTTPQIIISAAGNTKYFRKVEELVLKAPYIPGWEIIGFDPPQPIDFGIEELYGHTGIDPHNLWFMPIDLPQDGSIGVIVFGENFTNADEAFEKAVDRVIWNLLGERSACTDVQGIAVNNLSVCPIEERSELIKLQELPAYIERLKFSGLYVTSRGKIKRKLV